MLLYFQPLEEVDHRRCIAVGPFGPVQEYSELRTDTLSLTGGPQDEAAPICVHSWPPVTAIYLVQE